MRVLILSWEYPPIVEGGLARHVRKLSEGLVREGVEVHVITRGGARSAAREERHGVHVHRIAEPEIIRIEARADTSQPRNQASVAAIVQMGGNETDLPVVLSWLDRAPLHSDGP